jgi:hypothetical protein
MLHSICRSAGVLALSAAVVLASVPADATDCRYLTNQCIATVELTEHVGVPTLLCMKGDIVLDIVVTVHCPGGGGGSASVPRCGDDNQAIVINDGTSTYTLQPQAGYTWEDVYNDCGKLNFTIS